MRDLATMSANFIRSTDGFPHEVFHFTAAVSLAGAPLMQEMHVAACTRRPPPAKRNEAQHLQMCSSCAPSQVSTPAWVGAWHNALWAANTLRVLHNRLCTLEAAAPGWAGSPDVSDQVRVMVSTGSSLNGLSHSATLAGYITALVENTSSVVDTREHDGGVAALLGVRDVLQDAFDQLAVRYSALRDAWPASAVWDPDPNPGVPGIIVSRRINLVSLNRYPAKWPDSVPAGLAVAMGDVLASLPTHDDSSDRDLVAVRVPAGSLTSAVSFRKSVMWAVPDPGGVTDEVAAMALRIVADHAMSTTWPPQQLLDAIEASKMALLVTA